MARPGLDDARAQPEEGLSSPHSPSPSQGAPLGLWGSWSAASVAGSSPCPWWWQLGPREALLRTKARLRSSQQWCWPSTADPSPAELSRHWAGHGDSASLSKGHGSVSLFPKGLGPRKCPLAWQASISKDGCPCSERGCWVCWAAYDRQLPDCHLKCLVAGPCVCVCGPFSPPLDQC